MDAVRRLEIMEAVRVVKARYFRHMDRKEWDDFRELFTDDFEADVTDDMVAAGLSRDSGIRIGADRFVRGVVRALEGVRTVHHGHMPEIEVLDDEHASAVWAMEDRLDYPDGRVVTGGRPLLRGVPRRRARLAHVHDAPLPPPHRHHSFTRALNGSVKYPSVGYLTHRSGA
ncbi:MAG: nuclear transport factor 2 family protein [Actinomycetota bacterium]